jgi:hypothetical protein
LTHLLLILVLFDRPAHHQLANPWHFLPGADVWAKTIIKINLKRLRTTVKYAWISDWQFLQLDAEDCQAATM